MNEMAPKSHQALKHELECKSHQALRHELESKGVKYLLPSYVDMHGASKTKAVPIAHLERMMGGSELCTGAAVDGVPQNMVDEEVAAHPDPASCIIQPWDPEVAWFASDLWCEGKPFEPCSRNILKRVLAEARSMGYTINLGLEPEFFVFRDDEDGKVLPVSKRQNLAKPAYDVPRLLENKDWWSEAIDAMNALGWDVYSFDHEDGIGQFEIDFTFSDALTMADRFVFFRRMIDAIARKHGARASFMAKPFGNYAGSGAHYNMSIADAKTGKNLCVPDGADSHGCNVSEVSYHFIAGLMRHLPAICAVVAPTVNSYKRLVMKGSESGYTWAPVFRSWGGNNRTNTVRIPRGGGRFELRVADPMCNPYLGAALTIAAGLEGIREKLDPGKPNSKNLYEEYERAQAAEQQMEIGLLPRTLEEALDAFEANLLTKKVFGDKMFDAWVEFKRAEWASYITHVSDWEHKRYMSFY